jgi:hypothetical protein
MQTRGRRLLSAGIALVKSNPKRHIRIDRPACCGKIPAPEWRPSGMNIIIKPVIQATPEVHDLTGE